MTLSNGSFLTPVLVAQMVTRVLVIIVLMVSSMLLQKEALDLMTKSLSTMKNGPLQEIETQSPIPQTMTPFIV